MQWPDQIHANDSILTFGYSETVLVFLLEAAKKLDFQASSHMGRVLLCSHCSLCHLSCMPLNILACDVNVA